MKNTKKKGFTIVELVIVIAVIAILAAVLIPTFTSVIAKANESKAMQQAKSAWTDFIASELTDPTTNIGTFDGYVQSGDYYFAVTDGQFTTTGTKGTAPTEEGKTVWNVSATGTISAS